MPLVKQWHRGGGGGTKGEKTGVDPFDLYVDFLLLSL
jgi:hypothetical protein